MIGVNDGIELLSGATMNYATPEESQVTIEDIASALSNICRFAGHLPAFYSVAQHAVNVSRLVPKKLALTGLLHDTAEAFTNDLPSPLKIQLNELKELEVKLETAMADRFGFVYPLPDAVKLADLQMLAIEKTHVKRSKVHWEWTEGVEFEHLMPLVDITFKDPTSAYLFFMDRYEEIINDSTSTRPFVGE